ncbi:MAG: SDR family oxidoreductase [Saprospiraceae bacterium]|nr:SDR family oxidoreductase [Saprospiraceae bacterium]
MKPKKYALITGASMGIGYELAKQHAAHGDNVVLVARSAEKLKALASDLEKNYGIKALVLAKDLSKENVAQEIYDDLKNQGIIIEYLINNAGFGEFGMFYETDWAKEKQMIDLNITTLTHFCKLFLPDMIERRSGRIMNLGSTASFQPGPTMAVYFATKAFVLHFSEAIANEVADKGVTVTALCPGATESGFQAAANLAESKLIKGKKLPTSAEVAAYGYKAMMQGKAVAIHGFMNYLVANSVRFSPRSWVVRLVRFMQDKAGE